VPQLNGPSPSRADAFQVVVPGDQKATVAQAHVVAAKVLGLLPEDIDVEKAAAVLYARSAEDGSSKHVAETSGIERDSDSKGTTNA